MQDSLRTEGEPSLSTTSVRKDNIVSVLLKEALASLKAVAKALEVKMPEKASKVSDIAASLDEVLQNEDEFANQIDDEYQLRLVEFDSKLQTYRRETGEEQEPLLPPWARADDNDLTGGT